MKCCECTVPTVELCILCYSADYKDSHHSCRHSYTLVQGDLLRSTGLSDASVSSCLSLLDTSRRMSVGSWNEMSSRVNLGSQLECESVFMKLYKLWAIHDKPSFPEQRFALHDDCLLSSAHSQKAGMFVDALDIPESSDLPGFLKNRVDFDLEFDDSAELILADLELVESDSPEDTAIKLDCLKLYTERIKLRERAKRFVVEHGLINYQEQANTHRSRTVEQADLRGKLRPLLRFFDSTMRFEAFCHLVLNEQRVLNRIRALKEVKSHNSSRDQAPEEVEDSRPTTRSRAIHEGKRGSRAIEEECGKIRDLFTTAPFNDSLRCTLEPQEIELLSQLGFSPEVFAVLRHSILEISSKDTRNILMSKHGCTFSLEVRD